jgi:hypothetical protein
LRRQLYAASEISLKELNILIFRKEIICVNENKTECFSSLLRHCLNN